MIIGTTINSRYDIKMLIGDGGMANVYLAYDRTTKSHVAIKSLRYELSKDERFIKRFKRESAQVIDLNHPNIVQVYAVGDFNEQPFIVMEYVKGNTLKDFLREQGALSIETVLHIMRQLAKGVLYAHQNNIIHRDLKPQNIMITDDLEVKITDFGIALSSNEADVTQTNTIMGSVHYLAPELARGNIATERSDIYALGIILYELLTGIVPFKGEGAVNIALQHLEDEMPSIKVVNEDLPTSLDNVIKRCTRKSPNERYRTAEELIVDLNVEESAEPLPEIDHLEKTMVIPNLEKELKEMNEQAIAKPKFQLLNLSLVVSYTIFLILAIILYSVIVVFPARYTAQETRVPDVVNLSQEEAETLLKDVGLDNFEIRTYPNEDVSEGEVISISPAPGTRVKIDSKVSIHVAE